MVKVRTSPLSPTPETLATGKPPFPIKAELERTHQTACAPLAMRRPLATYLLGQPSNVLDFLAASRSVTGSQHGTEFSQDLREQSHDVGVDCHEPGMGSGCVLATEDHSVPAVRRVQLNQSMGGRQGQRGRSSEEGLGWVCLSSKCWVHTGVGWGGRMNSAQPGASNPRRARHHGGDQCSPCPPEGIPLKTFNEMLTRGPHKIAAQRTVSPQIPARTSHPCNRARDHHMSVQRV